MVVDPSKAFSRKSWNEDIIREVNTLCENPDTGCDPLETLEEVDEDHIWLEEDVIDVQDKLKEICPENEFDDLKEPQLWHYDEIIVPIEEAIERGWCGCGPNETEYDFGFFPQRTLEAGRRISKSAPTVSITPTGCGGFETITYLSPWYPVPPENEILLDIIQTAGDDNISTFSYTALASLVFFYEDNVEDIEDEITVLEGQIAAIEDDITDKEAEISEATTLRDYYCAEGPPSECTTYTTLVTTLEGDFADLKDDLQVKEGELEVKETELVAAQSRLDEIIEERNIAREEADATAQIIWAAQQSMELQYSTDIQPIRDLFPEMHEPWGDYFEDTRNKRPGKWYFYTDSVLKASGSFSPGGYPSGGITSSVVHLPNTCRYYDYTYHRDCNCPWEIPHRGTDQCEGTTRIWWKSVGLLDVDCSNVSPDEWNLSFKVKHSPDYTRPSPE
ncbi:hypothetical protein LCGC14_2021690 [marine sediment metagenome]|uniref:Uncharacterized protein n=1 Tax=marine sediment metagenome TaxID=412755 RepID=A0A0F9EXH3_9ZZZZ